MIYSPTCQHALRAMIHLAGRAQEGPVLVREIAEHERIPRPFLAKILHGLRSKGLVQSTKGPGGGYQLARGADEIRVLDVVEAIDGDSDLSQVCILGLDQCSDDEACALHDYWKRFRDQYLVVISELTLEDMAEVLRRKRVQVE